MIWPYPEAQTTRDDYVLSKAHPFPSFSLEPEEELTLAEPFAALGARRRHLHFNRVLVKADSNWRAACYNAVYSSCQSLQYVSFYCKCTLLSFGGL